MAIVSWQSQGPLGRITISRPERRNALNHAALDELHDAVRLAEAAEVRAVVLAGSDGHFCAGADLKELEDLSFTRSLRAVLDDLAGLPLPTVAAISGSCMGLGAQLALACDLRLATTDARFAVPVARLGLMVDHWTLQRLALLAGHSTARWMVLTAEPITAQRALEVGLVHRVVDGHPGPGGIEGGPAAQQAVEHEADGLARHLGELAPLSLAGSKLGLDLLERPDSHSDPEGRYREAFETAWASDDLVEGRRAFTERRPPRFEGR